MKTEETKVISARVSRIVFEKIEKMCKEENRRISNTVETILKQYFKLK